MKESRAKLILKYVLPTILSQCAFFLFTIIDGIFVGHGVGADGLGAVNLAQPLVMVIGAAFMLTTIGGVTITAIRIGRKDYEGAKIDFAPKRQIVGHPAVRREESTVGKDDFPAVQKFITEQCLVTRTIRANTSCSTQGKKQTARSFPS